VSGERQLSEPGTYLLLLRLAAPTELQVGRLGRLELPPGWYVYIGSALGGLGPRLRRHARRGKVLHWHVDALREAAELVAVAFRVGRERLECAAAARVAALAGARAPAPRFGASDCRCATHLVYFESEPDLRLDSDWVVRPCGPRTTAEAKFAEPGPAVRYAAWEWPRM
jgi:sugar fermentation stimulation protein A